MLVMVPFYFIIFLNKRFCLVSVMQMTNALGLVSFSEGDCLRCRRRNSRGSHRDSQGRQISRSCLAGATQAAPLLPLGTGQRDTWTSTSLPISCCRKAALPDHPKGPLSSASEWPTDAKRGARAWASISNRCFSLPGDLRLGDFLLEEWLSPMYLAASLNLFEP